MLDRSHTNLAGSTRLVFNNQIVAFANLVHCGSQGTNGRVGIAACCKRNDHANVLSRKINLRRIALRISRSIAVGFVAAS